MYWSDYYPAGAANDPNAPYNEPRPIEDVYGEAAEKELRKSIENFDSDFEEYVSEKYEEYFDFDSYDSLTKDIYLNEVPEDKREEIEDSYIDDKLTETCEELAEREYDAEEAARELAYDIMREERD